MITFGTRHSPRLPALCAFLGLAAPAAMAATTGNGHYQVHVNDMYSTGGIGVYTATTDILHPVTFAYGPQNVLFGGGVPSSSWTSIYSFTSQTTYTQRLFQDPNGPPPDPDLFRLESFAVPGEEAVLVGTTGFRTHYLIQGAGSGGGPDDDLDVFQTVRAVGTNFNDSAVELTTQIFNISTHDIDVGIRYLLDFQIGGGDDGPSFQLKGPDGPVQVLEQNLTTPAATTFEAIDNNDSSDFICQFGPTNTPFPLFAVGGSVRGPARLQPTAPTLLQFTSWPHISGLPGKSFSTSTPHGFFYNVGPHDAASCVVSIDDSGAAYYWGEAASNALRLAPGQSVQVTAYLFAYLPGQPPTFPPQTEICNDGVDNDGDGLVDQQDPDCAPLLVDLVSFEARSTRRSVTLAWSTASELDNAGFLVLRSTSPDGPFAPVSPFLIPAKGSPGSGASYAYEDRSVRRRRLYYYKLVDVDLAGRMTEHGPVAASAGTPRIEKRRR